MSRPPNAAPEGEQAGLPAWLYPAGFWVALGLLLVSVLWPPLALIGVGWVMLVPVLAALYVMVAGWRRDRRLGVAALAALLGLVVVFFAKQFL